MWGGFICRAPSRQLGVDKLTVAEYWAKEGRVHLELAAPVWHSGLTLRQTAAIEWAQRVVVAIPSI